MKVYQAINKVQAALAIEGISKDRSNQQQGYKFRGIDDVYNAMAPLLAKNGLCILPKVTARECVERVNAKGTALFYVTVAVDFAFVCAEDGSSHIVTTYGEAMDSGDKATNKAMSAAYKYACMQAFSIPTEGDNDADASTHEVKAEPRRTPGDSGSPTAILFDGLSADWQAYVVDLATQVENAFASAGPKAAKQVIDEATQAHDLDGTILGALSSKLGSKTRSQLKALKEAA